MPQSEGLLINTYACAGGASAWRRGKHELLQEQEQQQQQQQQQQTKKTRTQNR